MGYSNFKSLRQALDRLNLEELDVDLFPSVTPVEPSDWLKMTLEIAQSMPLTNEKSKSERVISNILVDAILPYKNYVTLYSGEDLPIDAQRDLAGECDFFIAMHPKKQVMQAPIITLAEAKDEDFDYGQGQCLAQMYGAQLYNQMKGKPLPFIYGCAMTDGTWKFMKLQDNQAFIDNKTYYLTELPMILGVFHQIIRLYLQP